MTRILYFARMRQIVGKGEEELSLPPGIETIAALIDWLKSRGEEYAAAFAEPKTVRAAIDRSHVRFDAPIEGAKEIAFFPPVTGG